MPSPSPGSRWLFVQRCWDETPAHMDFGMLHDELAPCARFFPYRMLCAPAWHVKAAIGCWRAQPCWELGVGKCGKHGVVDLFAQTLQFAPSDSDAYALVVPTRVLKGKKRRICTLR